VNTPGAGEQAGTFRVTLPFRKDGPSSSGWWTNPAVAEQEFTEWIGTYSSLEHVVIQLVEEHGDGRESTVKTWPEHRWCRASSRRLRP
jgi:hypothetical protein